MNETKSAKLSKKIFIEGQIELKTGLSIGGGSVGLEIGGADKLVVRNPINNQPYIPGSSLKGKMRSLLEKLEKGDDIKHKVTENVSIHQCGQDVEPCLICKIFGLPAEHKKSSPPRLIVRDGELKNPEVLEKSKFTDMPYTELKTEVVIDRITSAATPRSFERVPAGAIFNLDLVVNIYDNDNVSEILNKIMQALKLVQDDYLGGSGTRGYGKVKISINSPLKYKDQNVYENKENIKNLDYEIPAELKK